MIPLVFAVLLFGASVTCLGLACMVARAPVEALEPVAPVLERITVCDRDGRPTARIDTPPEHRTLAILLALEVEGSMVGTLEPFRARRSA